MLEKMFPEAIFIKKQTTKKQQEQNLGPLVSPLKF